MGVHLTELVRRAKRAGRLRADFEATEHDAAVRRVQATIAFGASTIPTCTGGCWV